MSFELHGNNQSGYEAARKLFRLLLAGNIGLDHNELVAAEPRYYVVKPGRRTQPLGDSLEQEISAIVPKRVIDFPHILDAKIFAALERRKKPSGTSTSPLPCV